MTYEEVCREVNADLGNVRRYNSHNGRTVDQAARRARTFPCTLIKEYVSPLKNRWLIVWHIFRKNTHNGGCGVVYGCLQKYQRGFALHYCLLRAGKVVLVTFHPHFFDRYAERMELDLKGVELIKKVVRRMKRFEVDDTMEFSGWKDRKENAIHILTDDGVGMGEAITDYHIVIKTFITYDMASGRQRDTFSGIRANMEDAFDKHRRDWREYRSYDV